MQTRVSLIKCFEVSDSTHSYSHSPFESFIMFQVIFASFLVLYGANGQLIFTGPCPNVTVQQSFNLSSYLGKWYQYKLYPAVFQPDGRCTTANYSLNPDGTVKVYNNQINITNGLEFDIEGWASLDNTSIPGEAKLTVRFPDKPTGSYWVLSTDYTTYSVVWSCAPYFKIPGSNFQFSWVLTRAQLPDKQTLASAQQVIDANGLSNNYTLTQQTNCQSQGWVTRSSFTYPVALGLFLMFRLVRLDSLTEFLV